MKVMEGMIAETIIPFITFIPVQILRVKKGPRKKLDSQSKIQNPKSDGLDLPRNCAVRCAA